jgi:hypothetical protein
MTCHLTRRGQPRRLPKHVSLVGGDYSAPCSTSCYGLGFEVRSIPPQLVCAGLTSQYMRTDEDRMTERRRHCGYVGIHSLHGLDSNTDPHLGSVCANAYSHPAT